MPACTRAIQADTDEDRHVQEEDEEEEEDEEGEEGNTSIEWEGGRENT